MTSEELYFQYQLTLNKNATQQNVFTPKANFVVLYNKEALNWLEDYIQKNSSTQKIHNVQGLLTVNAPLPLLKASSDYYTYSLPDNYFEYVESVSEAQREGCIGKVYNYLVKPKELGVNLDNEQPSFDFEESICNITENKLQVFVKDYKINTTYLSYYLRPERIDLEGYVNINDGTYSSTIDTSLDSRYQSQIIDRVVVEVMRQFENGNGYKLSQDRANANEQ